MPVLASSPGPQAPEGARAVPGSWPKERRPQLLPTRAPPSRTVTGAALPSSAR